MNSSERYVFASDNTAPICPEAWAALEEANRDAAPSYGDDRWTRRACDLVRETFEADCETFFVFNGTAANALALAHLCQPFHSILCHEQSHIETDECGAPEFFTNGSKLLRVTGRNGKIDLNEAAAVIARQGQLHSPKPRAISITQSTELGTVYTRAELNEVSQFAQKYSLRMHMDGARFANAVASADCAPREITWQAGVDVLSFGGTKNGTAMGDLVIFFNKELAREFDYRAKQAGQLASKMRYLAAPWVGLLDNNVWLRNARRANASAKLLAEKLRQIGILETAFPREANAVFLHLKDEIVRELHAAGWYFYKFIEPDIYRLMCSWSATERDIEAFIVDFKSAGKFC
jgi:threonine aldolase